MKAYRIPTTDAVLTVPAVSLLQAASPTGPKNPFDLNKEPIDDPMYQL